jgi:L,D-transpeptidase YcbB
MNRWTNSDDQTLGMARANRLAHVPHSRHAGAALSPLGGHMILGAFPSFVCVGVIVFTAAPALAQLGGAPIVPSDAFRRAPQAQVQAPAQPAAAAGPIYDEGTYARAAAALRLYSDIAARGGWPAVPKGPKLGPGASGPEVALLRRRLAVTGDLEATLQAGTSYDDAVVAAVKRFQSRHGLTETGSVGPLTFEALNVTAETRVRQLAA